MPGDWVASHLRTRGLIAANEAITVSSLSGGVSGELFEVETAARELVVKRARARLDVAQAWFADPGRVITEARALETAEPLVPYSVPRVLDLDVETATLVIAHAPREWTDWRTTLLAGGTGAGVAGRLGEMLAVWHRETADSPEVLRRFASQGAFEELRLAPFHEAVATAHPDLAETIGAAARHLREERLCLVHGDFSPKNVMHGEGGVWVLDWEVAHTGAPIFDLAFMLAHLTLKAVHRPDDAGAYRTLAAEFLQSYERAEGPVSAADPALCTQVGCLLLARVDGKSPAGYLTRAEAGYVRELARRQLGSRTESEELSPNIWEASR